MNARLSQLLYPDTSGILPVRFYTIPTLGQYQVNQLAGIPQGTLTIEKSRCMLKLQVILIAEAKIIIKSGRLWEL